MALVLICSFHFRFGKAVLSLESIFCTDFTLTLPTGLRLNSASFNTTKQFVLTTIALVLFTDIYLMSGNDGTERVANVINFLLQDNTALLHLIAH